MGERTDPRRANPSDLTVEVVQFSVPNWESVIIHEEDTHTYRGHPPPNMAASCFEAGKEGRLIAGVHHSKASGRTHPYVIGSTAGLRYLYACEPRGTDALSIFKRPPEHRYVFSTECPEDLSILYEEQGEEGSPHPYVIGFPDNVAFFVAPTRGGAGGIVQVSSEDEPPIAAAVRIAALYFMYGSLVTPQWPPLLSEVLPYFDDTPAITNTRADHIAKWQFKNSRTRPLFA